MCNNFESLWGIQIKEIPMSKRERKRERENVMN